MIGQVTIYKDDEFCLDITRNRHNGVTIQLTTLMPRMLPNSRNEMEMHLSPHVEMTETIHVRLQDGNLNPKFKQEVAASLKKFQHKLALLKQDNEHIEGLMKDYERIPG